MTDLDFFYFPKKAQKSYVNHLLLNCQQYCTHKVGILNIYNIDNNYFVVINCKSKAAKFYDTEEKAINHVLDLYPQTKFNQQTKLFDHEKVQNYDR